MGASEDAARESFALADQSEQQVLGFNGNAPELARFIARKKEHAPRAFRIAFEHPVSYVEGGTALLAL
jgi:hypothetical protein